MAGRHAAREDQTSEALANQGQFQPHRPRDLPEHRGGHQLGVKASPKDYIPESHLRTLPPGTAPPEHTFAPQNDFNYLAAESQQLADPLDFSGATNSGANSKDVNRGLGKPMSGMTSQEIHHEGRPGRKREKLGLTKHAANPDNRGGADLGRADPRDDPHQRALNEPHLGGTRSTKGALGAEDLPAEQAK